MHLVSWDNAVNRDRAELIFSNRNKEYGGYVIRRDYEKLLIYALLYTLAGIALMIAVPVILGMMSKPVAIVPKVPDDPSKWVDPSVFIKPEILPTTVTPPAHVPKALVFIPAPIVPDPVVPDPITASTQTNGSETGPVDITGSSGTTAGPANLVVEVETPPLISAEEMPIFPVGDISKYLARQIKYPAIDVANGIEGTVYISFVVDKEGKVKDVKVLRSISTRCDEEALRVVKSMPQWRPGKQNGRPVSVIFNVPVRFSLK